MYLFFNVIKCIIYTYSSTLKLCNLIKWEISLHPSAGTGRQDELKLRWFRS